jgi:hypothetical protein
MLASEHSHQHEPFNQYYQFEIQEHYPDFNMNNESFQNAATFASLPFSYYENPSLFVEAPQKTFDYETRSHSSHSSHQQISHDFPPSLLSSASGPSIASASSSTIGSPYSVHAQTVSSQDTWRSHHGLGFDPAIVNHEVFPPEYIGAGIDPELSFATSDKLHGSFVGECADLSSFQKRSSNFPVTVSSSSLSIPHQVRITASPEPLSIDSILDRASAASAAEHGSANLTRDRPPGPIRRENSSVQPSGSLFKSPTTPASAQVRVNSPTAHASVHAASYPPTATRMSRTPQQQSNPSSPPTQQHGNHFRTHFFAQSSGSFMPPLESSCSFPPRTNLVAFSSRFPLFPISLRYHDHRTPANITPSSDPSLIEAPRVSYADIPASYAEHNTYTALPTSFNAMSPLASPAPSPQSYAQYVTTPFSPSLQYNNLVQLPEYTSRRPSVSSYHSGQSPLSGSFDLDDDNKEKGRCPFPDCGRVFKDLKAHMLTHQLERPEKCPIVNCEYHQKGFARKYDKNRHTLTHYKGTMVCGFCPGSGSPAEKSFNRADVFKRHLTSVHGVEQAPPNSRKRSPTASTRKLASYCEDATGKCSTCAATFVNAQDFYEHLDDCVLRVVQQEEPSEAINHHHLANISQDEEVRETMERNMVKTEESFTSMEDLDEEDDEDEDDDEEEEDSLALRTKVSRTSGPSRAVRNGGISKPGRPRKLGLTYSKGGVPLIGRGRKKRKDYPPSWGMSADRMQMKKRVLCVYDGQRRLWKDDLMMHNEFEVRMSLPDGKSYVTDLDVETLKRAQAFHNATEEEKGPWVPEQPAYDLNALMA